MSEVTFVTMFFDIGRKDWGGSFSRSVQDYLLVFEKLRSYNYKMVVYIDDRYVYTGDCPNVEFIPINEKWLEDNFWSWRRLDIETAIMNRDSYKKMIPRRIELGYPENTNPKYTILTHSKIDAVVHAIDNGYVDTDLVAWIDFGYFHRKETPNFLPKGPFDTSKLDLDRVNICLINDIDDEDRDPVKTLIEAKEKIGAYFFIANKDRMREFQELSHKWLIVYQEHLKLADDEQALWLQCYFDRPHLFKKHVFNRWHAALHEFS